MSSQEKPIQPRILSIAGSDSSGGAGIQADTKTITVLGGYAMTAITAVTAQDTTGVHKIALLEPGMVAAQVTACLQDIGADAVKIGMLGSPEIAEAVLGALEGFEGPVVFDPVMVATSGASLADEATIASFERWLTRAEVVTPNLPELEALAGHSCPTGQDVIEAALAIARKHGCAVLAKGGHSADDLMVDRLVFPHDAVAEWEGERIDTPHTHGTGCTMSAAIATLLGHGQDLRHAVELSRKFVRQAIEAAPGFGKGNGPLGHNRVGRG
ncbi:bifunctional hydroxymethylpyrimidine kinase/phosphomethylpyrimidine kinase [Paraurantiacibacter namhicola]|uniref:hydroxymethylpyrimidine kinase n=1 Tax=Paraurantiacibacter namhicola TaxID=645517 RepID=A0A1C7DBI8_9SPHN|nr:bifunctional hydroxymethylpyrimidine kinase/phosphomethylpyrimidine kinase [Paraurantiacibacter namhicola]ANU08787.1 Hydroxymethylpyrimidine/phosphomethylpyrimidine kinase [Paraurantiacibacter namhicola]